MMAATSTLLSRICFLCCFFVLLSSLFLPVYAQDLEVGYGFLAVNPGDTTPATTALFRLTNPEGVLVSEAGVGAGVPVSKGRIFVQRDEGTNTGLALANHSDSSTDVTLVLRDAVGLEIGRVELTLASNEHKAAFLDEFFLAPPSPFVGTLTFQASGDERRLGAVTLRQGVNSFGEPTSTTLPVADLSDPAGTQDADSLVFPHLGVFATLSTQIILFGGAQEAEGVIEFFASDGSPLEVLVDGMVDSAFSFRIPPEGALFSTLATPDPSEEEPRIGYAVVRVEEGTPVPFGSAIFRFLDEEGRVVSEAGVGAGPSTTRSRLFVDNLETGTGVAVANPRGQQNRVDFDLMDPHGQVLETKDETLPANGHLAKFADEIFDGLPEGFKGSLEIRSQLPVHPITLKLSINRRSQPIITTLPVADLVSTDSGSTLVIAQLGVGDNEVVGDFSTRLIAVSPDTAEISQGNLGFWTGAGERWQPAGAPSEMAFAVGAGGIADIPLEANPSPLVMERGPSASALVTSDGASIEVVNERGDIITLTVLPHALLTPETITVTALESPPKRFFFNNVFPGVLLEPDGLILNEPAHLEVELATPIERPEMTSIFWLASDDLAVPAPDQFSLEGSIESEIQHFSAYTGEEATFSEAAFWTHMIFAGDRQAFPGNAAASLEPTLVDLVVSLGSIRGGLEFLAILQMLGLESDEHEVERILERARIAEKAEAFLRSPLPDEPCGDYFGVSLQAAALLQRLGAGTGELLQQRLTTLSELCLEVDLTGIWTFSSSDAAETCRLTSGCQRVEGCEWVEEDEDPPAQIQLVQEGSSLAISFLDLPQADIVEGEVKPSGREDPPYFVDAVIDSDQTPSCQIFFQSSAASIDFGVPVCGPEDGCQPVACREELRFAGEVNGEADISGREFWDFRATVRQTSDGRLLSLRCLGEASFRGAKEE